MFSGACSAHQGTPLQLGSAKHGLAGGREEPHHPWGMQTRCGLTSQGSCSSATSPHLFILSFRQLPCVHWQCFSNAPLEQRILCVREKHQLCLLRFMLSPGSAHPRLEATSTPWDPP